LPVTGFHTTLNSGQYIIDFIRPGGPGEIAGLQAGDTIISSSLKSVIAEKKSSFYATRAGDTLACLVIKNKKEVTMDLVMDSIVSEVPGFFQAMYALILLLSAASIYILFKKPDDPAIRIFFIFIQLYSLTQNATYLSFQNFFSVLATVAFICAGCLCGVALFHFHLLFPKPVKILTVFKHTPLIFYGIGSFIAVCFSAIFILVIHDPTDEHLSLFDFANGFGLKWLAFTFTMVLGIVIYQFVTIKNTLARKQILVVVIGSFFGFITPVSYAIFEDFIDKLGEYYPYIVNLSEGAGSLIMIICLLIAIFRYRIWDVEIFIRKALLYLGATLLITFTYLLLIWVVDRLIIRETDLTRFLILAISVILFLVLRDRLQQLIDRFFHRESYDSATVVSDFEEKLAGVYRFDELKLKVVQSLDEIFHFKSFVFNLKTKGLCYDPVFVLGSDDLIIAGEFEGNAEFEQKLRKSEIFSPEELNSKPSIFEKTYGELIVPLLERGQPNGFLICGQKRSERAYSLQDIRILSHLARRVTALFHTAGLYQNDLDRQLMLERERARISQDMHDDIGAGLTKIAMISEAKVKSHEQGREDAERMSKVAATAREMISRLNVIVWALNPKYDSLDSLIAYSRRYFGEYLENSGIRFKIEVPDIIPDLSITPDFRRNAFYALQEAIHNAVKHGACSEIAVRMKIIQKTMEMTVTDNGKGFDHDTTSHGNGLLNMKKRAEDLGGSFYIQSSPATGTSVLFNINLYQGNR
jgi:signal transduction histidine kinase